MIDRIACDGSCVDVWLVSDGVFLDFVIEDDDDIEFPTWFYTDIVSDPGFTLALAPDGDVLKWLMENGIAPGQPFYVRFNALIDDPELLQIHPQAKNKVIAAWETWLNEESG